MNVQWRQQHYNNSCACACVAMLLSGYGIDKQDDDVITEAKMPYRLEHDPAQGGSFTAGVLVQAPEVFNSMLQGHQLMLYGPSAKSWNEFQRAADGCLSRQAPFMTSLPVYILPSPGYDQFRQRGDKGRRHAVVVYSTDGQSYSVMDPLGGLDRTKTHLFSNVQTQVDLRVDKTALSEGLESSGRPYPVHSLQKWDGKQAMAILDVLNRTRATLAAFVLTVERFGAEIAKSPADRHEDVLYDYLGRCFKPIALDWRTAIEAQKGRGQPQYQLIEEQYNFQDLIMKQQKQMKEQPAIGAEFCDALVKSSQRIIQLSAAHLSTAFSI